MEKGPNKDFGYPNLGQEVYHPQQEPAHGYPAQAAHSQPQQYYQQQGQAMSPPDFNQPLYNQPQFNSQHYQQAPSRSGSCLRGFLAFLCCGCCFGGSGCCCGDRCCCCGDRCCCCDPSAGDN